MQQARPSYLTPEEYLAMERQAETKSEYFNGEVYAMAGASLAHIQIAANVITALITRFKDRPCRRLAAICVLRCARPAVMLTRISW